MSDLVSEMRSCSGCVAPGHTGRKCGKCYRCLCRRGADRIELLEAKIATLRQAARAHLLTPESDNG